MFYNYTTTNTAKIANKKQKLGKNVRKIIFLEKQTKP